MLTDNKSYNNFATARKYKLIIITCCSLWTIQRTCPERGEHLQQLQYSKLHRDKKTLHASVSSYFKSHNAGGASNICSLTQVRRKPFSTPHRGIMGTLKHRARTTMPLRPMTVKAREHLNVDSLDFPRDNTRPRHAREDIAATEKSNGHIL